MIPRRRLLVALGVVAALLFAGRWTAVLLADRWWAAALTAAGGSFLTQWHLLRLAIDVGAVLVAAAWFIGNLIQVGRAVGSVLVPRHVANIEFREAVRPNFLGNVAVLGGALVGLLAGLDASREWATVALAWHGVGFGIADPVLGHDLGLYVAQLPLWRALHAFAQTLVGFGLILILGLYIVVGAVRVSGRRLAINDHARRHLGWLLAALALVLAWGSLLAPYEAVAGIGGLPDRDAMRRTLVLAPALAGTALMVALASAVWALRARHALLVSGWSVLVLAIVVARAVVPLFGSADRAPAADATATATLERAAFGLDGLEAGDSVPSLIAAPLWAASVVPNLVGEAESVRSVDAATIDAGGETRPAWLALTAEGTGPAALVAVASDRAGAGGSALFYRLADTLAYPVAYPYAALSAHAARPGSKRYDLSPGARGIDVGPLARRLALAWALQAGELLGAVPDTALIAWALHPSERLSRLAPFATWSAPRPVVRAGRVHWVAHGYVTSRTFPLTAPIASAEGGVNMMHAGFAGIVDAESGATRIHLAADAGPVARAWAEIAGGLVTPADAGDSAIVERAGYPEELFAAQSRVLGRGAAAPGRLAVSGTDSSARRPLIRRGWAAGTSAVTLLAVYERRDRVGAILTGAGPATVALLSPGSGLRSAGDLERSWSRFATFEPIRDSVEAAGARIERGPVQLWRTPEGLAALQVHVAARPGARPAIVWVSVGAGDRLGAGRTVTQAWDNLRGATVPAPPGADGGPLTEARRWMAIADAALRRGDWEAFGRAFDSLKRVLHGDAEPAP